MKQILKRSVGALLLTVCLVFSFCVIPAMAEQTPENSEKSAIEIPVVAEEAYDDVTAAEINFNQISGKDVLIQPITVHDGQFYFVYQFADVNAEKNSDTCILSLHTSEACDETDRIGDPWKGKSDTLSGTMKLPAGNYYLKIEFQKKKNASYYAQMQAMTIPTEVPKEKILKKDREYYYYNASGKTVSVKITLPKDGQIYLFAAYDDFLQEDYQNPDISIYDASGKKVAKKHKMDAQFGKCYALKAGTYTLKIQGKTGMYSIYSQYQAYVDGKNHTKAAAKKMLPGQKYTSLLKQDGTTSGDVWYRFSLKKDSKNKLKLYNYSGNDKIHYVVYRGKEIVSSGILPSVSDENTISDEIEGMATSVTVSGSKISKKGTYYVRFYRTSSLASGAVGIYQTPYMNLMQIRPLKNQVYSGSMKLPAPVIYNGSEKLREDKDYVLTYTDNQKIGTASVKIEGLGKYKGSTKITFQIRPKQAALTKVTPGKKKLTAHWKKVSGVSGYEVRYATNKSMKHAKTLTVRGSSKTFVKISGLKGKKKYYVQVRAFKKKGSAKYRGSWSAPKKVKTRK